MQRLGASSHIDYPGLLPQHPTAPRGLRKHLPEAVSDDARPRFAIPSRIKRPDHYDSAATSSRSRNDDRRFRQPDAALVELVFIMVLTFARNLAAMGSKGQDRNTRFSVLEVERSRRGGGSLADKKSLRILKEFVMRACRATGRRPPSAIRQCSVEVRTTMPHNFRQRRD